MPDIIQWPCNMRRVHAEYFLRWTTRSVGFSLAGHEQIVTPNAGVWEVSITFPRLFKPEDVKSFEAKVSKMRGRTNIANVCICDPYKYAPDVGGREIPFSDGTWFSDGRGFADPSGGANPAYTAVPAAVGATSITLDMVGPPAIPPMQIGDMFSVNGFLHRVTASSSAGLIEFEPPLRRPVSGFTSLRTNPPQFYGRFATDDEGRMMREYLKWGEQVTVRFVEAFDR